MNKKAVVALAVAGLLLIPAGSALAMSQPEQPELPIRLEEQSEQAAQPAQTAQTQDLGQLARQALEQELGAPLEDWKVEVVSANSYLFRPQIPTVISSEEYERMGGDLSSLTHPDFYVVELEVNGEVKAITKNLNKQQYYEAFDKQLKG